MGSMRDDDTGGLGPWAEFGEAASRAVADDALGTAADDAARLADAPHATGFGDAPAQGFGHAPDAPDLPDLDGFLPLGQAVRDASERVHAFSPPPGYHNQVDADGDGHLDHATYRGDGHGGVEILVDLNGDGAVDFIGHDTDLDNKVDYAEYDNDHDGVFEKRMDDDDNDGILDRTTWLHDGGHGS